MSSYVIREYQKGFDHGQARIGIEVARDWAWPYAYNQEGLLKIHAQPDFDPDTHHYCFLGGEMVGYLFSTITSAADSQTPTANLDFPRVLPGHEQAAVLLLERALKTLKKKGVRRVAGRLTTMCPENIYLAEHLGFSIRDWGYKVYYSYEMKWGKLNNSEAAAEEIDPTQDLDECALLASRWYRFSMDWCRAHLQEWHKAGIITHLGVRDQGTLVAACMVAPNDVRPSTAGIYYIYTPDEASLSTLLRKVVNKCVDYGSHNVIADLIHEQRRFEPIYQLLGFKKAAEWALCEKPLV